MIIRLVKEKRRSFNEVVREQNRAEYLLILAFAPLTALFAWRATTLQLQLGYLMTTLTLIVAAAVIFLHYRRASMGPDEDLNVREYHRRLLETYDSRIRFLKSVKFWYAIPLLLGVTVVAFPAWNLLIHSPWNYIVHAALVLLVWLWIWHMNDVRRVADLERKKGEVQAVLAEIDRECKP